ncbi:hypothetical protein E1292_49805 [Nonomuraea deserti]|uniref:ABM domain-containing protein n=1 Tax=Nonomuraea deserti TaxID=1848322 RepID=A0A4R4U673_9ACTN|nr:hypothetical protein [Nonomuraea deserti]TDC83632.1 hypothetical protein E1292_49805 [Nonomuraea deserti]
MYAIVRHYNASSGSIEEMVEQVDREFADRIPEQVGSILYTAVHTGDGTAMTITMFADTATANRSEQTVAQVQQALAARFGVSETAVHRGEVLVSRASQAVAETVRFTR